MKLSYSEYRTYIDCPKKYHLEDTKVKYPEKESKYFALYGLLIEMFFKNYSNIYAKRSEPLLPEEITLILRRMWDKILEENYVDWRDPWVKKTSEQIFEEVRSDIDKNLETFDLIWKQSRSEISFDIFLKKTRDTITCRMDFIVEREDGSVEIIDGKGTSKMDRVDIDQLYFYIFVYYLHYGKLPDKAGFLFYKFQHIQYIDFDKETISNFRKKLSLVKSSIKTDTVFEAKVKISKVCRWCPYSSTCVELIDTRSKRASKRRSKIGLPVEFEGGIQSFSPRGFFE